MLHARTGSSRPAGRYLALVLGGLLLLVGKSPPAEATTVRGLSLLEKCEIAQTIVLAEVVSLETNWEREGQSAKTLIRFRVRESYKGTFQPGSELFLHQAGGKIGDFVHEIPGMSQYRVGEEAILFLEGFRTEQVEIGVGIGKYGIEKDGSGAKFVTHDPKVALVYTKVDGSMAIEESKPMTPEALGKFTARIASYLSGARKASGQSGPTKMSPALRPNPIPGKK